MQKEEIKITKINGEKTTEEKITSYSCNSCKKELPNKSLSLSLADCRYHNVSPIGEEFHSSGVAKKPKLEKTPWISDKHKLCGEWLHFCDPDCLNKYFSALWKKIK